MVWEGLVQERNRTGGGTHRASDGGITGDSPNLLILGRPNFGSVGIYPILDVVVGSQWDELVQCGEDITRRSVCCQSLVRDMPGRSRFSHRPIRTGLKMPYPVSRGTLVYLPCNNNLSG